MFKWKFGGKVRRAFIELLDLVSLDVRFIGSRAYAVPSGGFYCY